MDGIIGCTGCVTVSTGVAVAQEYDADGNVVGHNGVPLTLGNSDGATSNTVVPGSYGSDNYISNMATNSTGGSDNQLSQGIVITLTKGYSFTGTFSFDYEIFPDISCTVLNSGSCGGWNSSTGHYNNQPDLDFMASGGSTSINTTFWGVTPSATGTDGSTWEIRSSAVDLAHHVGHTVDATGVVSNSTMHNMKEDSKDLAKDSGMKKDNTEHGHLKVTDLKMVSDSCNR